MIHLLRRVTAVMMTLSILLVTTVPTVSAATCDMPGMDGVSQQTAAEQTTSLFDWQECYIECGCRVDNHIDGMPHQLAPHTLFAADFQSLPVINRLIGSAEAMLSSRPLPFAPPPPRTI